MKSIFLSKIVLQHWLLICKLRKKSFVLFPYISKKFTLSKRSRITIFENAINVQDSNTTEYSKGCRYSSVDSSAPSILPPQVWVPSTPSTLSSIYIAQIVYLSFELECEKNKNKQKEAGIGPFKKRKEKKILILLIEFSTRRWRLVSPNCLASLYSVLHELSLLFCHFINVRAYHLGWHEPSSPST